MLFPFNVEMQLSQNKSTLLSELLQTVCVCVLLLHRVSSLGPPGIVHVHDNLQEDMEIIMTPAPRVQPKLLYWLLT